VDSATKVERLALIRELHAALRAGKSGARERLIEANQDLARDCVKTVLGSRRSQWADDVLGACLLALVVGVDALAKRDDIDDPLGYLYGHMLHAARACSAKTHIVPRTRRGRRAGKQTLPPSADLSHTRELADRDTLASDDLWEELLVCCQHDSERQVLVGFAAGHNAKQIAKTVALTPSGVYEARNRVCRRYEDRNDCRIPRGGQLKEENHVLAA
jgi:hypothetical protein